MQQLQPQIVILREGHISSKQGTPAATSHAWPPTVALYVVTLEGSLANANVTIKDETEIPLTFTCGRAEKTT